MIRCWILLPAAIALTGLMLGAMVVEALASRLVDRLDRVHHRLCRRALRRRP